MGVAEEIRRAKHAIEQRLKKLELQRDGATDEAADLDARCRDLRASIDELDFAQLHMEEGEASEAKAILTKLQHAEKRAVFVPPAPTLKQVPLAQPIPPTEGPVWSYRYTDWDHREWGAAGLSADEWWSIQRGLRDYEEMTWSNIPLHDNSNHEWEVADLVPAAGQRLTELKRDWMDPLYQLRLQGAHRIVGWRSGRVFHIVWYDLKHTLYPVKKKNT